MAEPRARVLEYAVDLDAARRATSDRGGAPLVDDPDVWTPEHLVLAGLARCALQSLAYHARRAGSEATATARVQGAVTRRASDGRFAFVRVTLDVSATLDPPVAPEALPALLAKAERDCFVGASLCEAPTYRFTVDGEEIR